MRICSTIYIVQVRCDRGQPGCGWCTRNGQLCEYKERKKPGLRAGYGRELERRLGIDYRTCSSSPISLLNKCHIIMKLACRTTRSAWKPKSSRDATKAEHSAHNNWGTCLKLRLFLRSRHNRHKVFVPAAPRPRPARRNYNTQLR